jgi:hypothetical protein
MDPSAKNSPDSIYIFPKNVLVYESPNPCKICKIAAANRGFKIILHTVRDHDMGGTQENSSMSHIGSMRTNEMRGMDKQPSSQSMCCHCTSGSLCDVVHKVELECLLVAMETSINHLKIDRTYNIYTITKQRTPDRSQQL